MGGLRIRATVLLVIGSLLTVIAPAGARHGDDHSVCMRREATIVGTSDRDHLQGTAGDDVIAGLAGDDFIDGGGGNDVICGDEGEDHINGDAGTDVIWGAPDMDWID